MCGRFIIHTPSDDLKLLFELVETPPVMPPRYNVAPSQPIPVVRQGKSGRHLSQLQWGIIPYWAKEPPSPPPINARGETLEEKPMYRDAFQRRRCLIPANGFYEWKSPEQGKGPKQPYLIREHNGGVFAMGGVWERWRSPAGQDVETVAIITTAANATLQSLHDRMPLILGSDDWVTWLDPKSDLVIVKSLVRPAPDESLITVPVSSRVNAVANDDPSLIEEVDPEKTQAETGTQAKQPQKRDDRQLDLF
jgi:putative SOS response-associated peptidase YedK